jgi:hypothetical protein
VLTRRLRRHCVVTVLAWAIVRVVQWLSGVTYSDAYLDLGWQMVPRETLRHDVLGSVWYLHVQPPLYNLTIGTILRWSPLSDVRSTQIFILGCSLAAAVGLQRLATLLGFSPRSAVVLATLLLADPYMIRYELEPTYEIPMLALIVWALMLLHRAVSSPTLARYAAASATLTAIVLTRSLFHPLWLAAIVVGMFACRPAVGWRPLAIAAAVPMVFVGAVMIKNEAVFGEATLSSWLGMNMERGVIAPMDRQTVEAMVADGRLGTIVTVVPFVDYGNYRQYVAPCAPTHRHPAVSQQLRPNGYADFNYECFLPVYSAMSDASFDAVRAQPAEYLRSRVDAMKLSADHVLDAGYGRGVLGGVRPVSRVAFVDIRSDVDMTDWFHPLFGPGRAIVHESLVVVAAWLTCCVLLCRRVWRLIRRRASPEDLLVAACAFTVVWVVLTGALLEMGENARFRAMVHPLLILVALTVFRRRDSAALSGQLAAADEPLDVVEVAQHHDQAQPAGAQNLPGRSPADTHADRQADGDDQRGQ